MLNDCVQFARRGDEAEFVGMRISPLAIEVDLVTIEFTRRVEIGIPKRIPQFFFTRRRGEESRKNNRDIAALIFIPAEGRIAVAFGDHRANFEAARFSQRARVIALVGKHVPCEVLMRVNDQIHDTKKRPAVAGRLLFLLGAFRRRLGWHFVRRLVVLGIEFGGEKFEIFIGERG